MAADNGVSKNTIYKLINELKDAGYIIQSQKRSESGKFSATDYLVFRSLEDARFFSEQHGNTGSEPCPKNRDTAPCPKKRDTVNRVTTKKDCKKEKEVRKEGLCARAKKLPLYEEIITYLLSDELAQADPQTIRTAKDKAMEYAIDTPAGKLAAGCRYVREGIRIEAEKQEDRLAIDDMESWLA